MADEAFALSPISARATLPSEADYDAIREAFMETSRGRWFLTEYARRNRNADTTMVLDAVARIEQTLVAQKQSATEDGLTELLAAIRSGVDEARSTTSDTLDGNAMENALAPVRKGARVIREIAWRLREIGADSRICDLIDSQVGSIEAGCTQLAENDTSAALRAAFDLIEHKIDECAGGEAAAPLSRSEPPPPPASSVILDEAPATTPATSAVTATPPDAIAEPVHAEALNDDTTAQDEAVLDMIALEMGASDFDEPEPSPEIVVEITEIAMAPEPKPVPTQLPQPSLGATLIANGIVPRPERSITDPLAPIRRMSQAERIALFS